MLDDGIASVDADTTGMSVEGASVVSSSTVKLANASLTDGTSVVVVVVVVAEVVVVLSGVVERRRPITTVFAETVVGGFCVVDATVVRRLPDNKACRAPGLAPVASDVGLDVVVVLLRPPNKEGIPVVVDDSTDDGSAEASDVACVELLDS